MGNKTFGCGAMIKYRKSVVGQKKDPLNKSSNNKIHVLLVYGGLSSERDVSLLSYKRIEQALLELGYSVTTVDMGHDFLEVVKQIQPDVVFNGLYGTYGEDGHVPALLNILGIKYTHSGILSSALGFNKKMSFSILKANNINCAQMNIIDRAQAKEIGDKDPIPRPYVIKPISEGSSIGVEVIFGVIELIPLKKRFYDYESKYTDNMTEHLVPAPLSKEEERDIMAIAEKVHHIFGCKTISRVDFRYNPEEKNKPHKGIYVLEINTHPGMTPLSMVPEICLGKGIKFNQIMDILVKDGLSGRNS